MCAATARPPWRWTSATTASTVERRRHGQGERLARRARSVGGEHALLAEEARRSRRRSAAASRRPRRRRPPRPRRRGRGRRRGTSSAVVISMPASTVRRVAGGLLHGGGVARAVVVADGDHGQSLSERLATIAGGVMSLSAQGESAVWTCRSAAQTFTHGSPSRPARRAGRRRRTCRPATRRARCPLRRPWRTTSSSGRRPPAKITAASSAWLATAMTLRWTCSVTSTPPSGACASTSLSRSDA